MRGGRMRIGFVGAGKVGFTFGKYLVERDMHVSGYYSRSFSSAKEAAQFTNTKYYEIVGELVKNSDTLFLTVPDSNIRETYNLLKESDIEGKIICHCSGALSSKIFQGISQRGAYAYSIHPIFAVSSKLTSYQELSKAYFTIEGDQQYLEQMAAFIRELGNPVQVIATEKKAKYHAASVVASNLVIGLLEQTAILLKDCGLEEDFADKALLSLFVTNCQNLEARGREAALTGPVERGDISTVQSHLAVLDKETKQTYINLSKQIVKVAKRKNPDRDYRELEQLLRKEG